MGGELGGQGRGNISPPSKLKLTPPPAGLLWGLVFQEFVKMTNYDVEHTIKKEMSGDVRDVFVAIGNLWGLREGDGYPGKGLGALGMWPESLGKCGLGRFLSS